MAKITFLEIILTFLCLILLILYISADKPNSALYLQCVDDYNKVINMIENNCICGQFDYGFNFTNMNEVYRNEFIENHK